MLYYISSFLPDSYFGQGHSFHGTGGRSSKKAQMRHCIRVMRSVTSIGEDSVNQDLCDQGTINQLLGKLDKKNVFYLHVTKCISKTRPFLTDICGVCSQVF